MLPACFRASTTRCAVRILIAPNSIRFAFPPVIGTMPAVPIGAQAARSGGNTRKIVQSLTSTVSPGLSPALRRRRRQPFSARDDCPVHCMCSAVASRSIHTRATGGEVSED
jgi:hypothetical protein